MPGGLRLIEVRYDSHRGLWMGPGLNVTLSEGSEWNDSLHNRDQSTLIHIYSFVDCIWVFIHFLLSDKDPALWAYMQYSCICTTSDLSTLLQN